ncbi:MAG: carboxypeptidase-like regulatory domain-containing protein, partial [Ferruginibacter sp.]
MTKPRLNGLFPFLVFIFASLLFNTSVFAQKSRISGTIYGINQQPLPYASVRVIEATKKDSTSIVSETDGFFEMTTNLTGGEVLVVSYLGYQRLEISLDSLTPKGPAIQLGSISMLPEAGSLQEVTLTAQKIQIKEDTVSYLVDSTMYRKTDNVEALLKNLPGVQVDKDGTVTAQGKQVTKVKVNGKEFFGGDVTTATRELNADMVDRIQIIDDYGDMAAFTGIKDGDPTKTLNIQLRKDKSKGTFGTLNAGVGTENRYQNNFSVNQFNNDFQLSVLGNLNNTNARMFNFGSGGGGGGMGNMVSGMARSMGIGRGGGGVGAIIGNAGGNNDGISKSQSVGVNYRDAWGRKTSVYGSYSYSNRDNQTISQSTQQTLFSDKTQTFIQQNDNQTQTINHRFQFNVEVNIDSFNYLKFSP